MRTTSSWLLLLDWSHWTCARRAYPPLPISDCTMIRKTFLILDGIRESTEQRIWHQGISDWNDFLVAKEVKGIAATRKLYYDRQLLKARAALFFNNSPYFMDKLPAAECWRLYRFFREEAVFLDIESTGIETGDAITVVGLFDGISAMTMIRGINFDAQALREELKKYKLLITFNGASFDLPYIKRRYPDVLPNVPHLDLKHACAKLGIAGGLKLIEQELCIMRANPLVEKLRGGDPAALWRMFRATGDEHYLRMLVEYNAEDVMNLQPIADIIYKRLEERCYSTKPLASCT